MKKPKVYTSNGGLGYNQYAYLIKIKKAKRGDYYLCIDASNVGGDNETYVEGKLVDLEDIYIEESDAKIEDFPIYKEFLFQHFLKTFKFGK